MIDMIENVKLVALNKGGVRDFLNEQGPYGIMMNIVLPVGVAYCSASFGERVGLLKPAALVIEGLAVTALGLALAAAPAHGVLVPPEIANMTVDAGVRIAIGGVSSILLKPFVAAG